MWGGVGYGLVLYRPQSRQSSAPQASPPKLGKANLLHVFIIISQVCSTVSACVLGAVELLQSAACMQCMQRFL